VTLTTSPTEFTQSGKRLYMLYQGNYERNSYGPYIGDSGLDFAALSAVFRSESYALAEAKADDYCSLYESDFPAWLVAKGILSPVETTGIEISVSTSGGDAYVPKHWPVCPDCGNGRGDPQYGDARKSLNRIKTYKRCTECGHEWGHTEVANDTSKPMLDDDGRDTPGACVPFALAKACGIEFATVLDVCARHGWSGTGMAQTNAIFAARELGFSLAWVNLVSAKTPSAPTLKRLLPELNDGRNYVAGVKGHWLAIVDGQIMDNDANTGLGRKVLELYEVRMVQAMAA